MDEDGTRKLNQIANSTDFAARARIARTLTDEEVVNASKALLRSALRNGDIAAPGYGQAWEDADGKKWVKLGGRWIDPEVSGPVEFSPKDVW